MLQTESIQRPWPKYHSGVACSLMQYHADQQVSTGVPTETTRALPQYKPHIAAGSRLQRPCSLSTRPLAFPCLISSAGSRLQRPCSLSTRPLTPSASFLHHLHRECILGHENSTLLKKNFALEIYLFTKWRIIVDIVFSSLLHFPMWPL